MDKGSGVTYPSGFTAAGVACGIKKNGGPDLAIIKCGVLRPRSRGIYKEQSKRPLSHALP